MYVDGKLKNKENSIGRIRLCFNKVIGRLMSIPYLLVFFMAIVVNTSWAWSFMPRRSIASAAAAISLSVGYCSVNMERAVAKDSLPSLEKCFNAIEKELDYDKGESIKRLKMDIASGNWEDIKLFTREYDAGFRGGVLKSAWKQLKDDAKSKGIAYSNAFTFDLIALNKAARVENSEEASMRLEQVKKDLQDFLTLRPAE